MPTRYSGPVTGPVVGWDGLDLRLHLIDHGNIWKNLSVACLMLLEHTAIQGKAALASLDSPLTILP
jgi:hypothetical protein